jgi:hypothetical protein
MQQVGQNTTLLFLGQLPDAFSRSPDAWRAREIVPLRSLLEKEMNAPVIEECPAIKEVSVIGWHHAIVGATLFQ